MGKYKVKVKVSKEEIEKAKQEKQKAIDDKKVIRK
jgi:hypothetical protein